MPHPETDQPILMSIKPAVLVTRSTAGGLRRVANLGSAGDRTLSCVFVSKSSVSCARANWLEVWLTMRPRFTARPLSEITPIVRPEAQQNPSDPVISESYRGSEHALPDPKNCMVAARANVGCHKY